VRKSRYSCVLLLRLLLFVAQQQVCFVCICAGCGVLYLFIRVSMGHKAVEGIIDAVQYHIGVSTLNKMVTYAEHNKPGLWGEQQPYTFLKHMVAMTIYKDMKNIGYNTLCAKVDFGYTLNHKSLQHNIKALREVLGQWGKETIKLGEKTKWSKAAMNTGIPKVISKKKVQAYLWADSTDFPRKKFKGYTKKSPWHSYKLNRPGRRYMFIRDGKGKVVKLWGGYTPKLYDGHFVEDHREEIDEKLEGATIFGDQHFTYGARFVKRVQFFTPLGGGRRDPDILEEVEGDEEQQEDPYDFEPEARNENNQRKTKKEEEWKVAVTKVRARVENTFGYLKTKFKSLCEPFQESARQHDYLVWYAVGIYNTQL
jgi:DDE superfamily endonuclease